MRIRSVLLGLVLLLAVAISPASALVSQNSRQGVAPISAEFRPEPPSRGPGLHQGFPLRFLEILVRNGFSYSDPYGLSTEDLNGTSNENRFRFFSEDEFSGFDPNPRSFLVPWSGFQRPDETNTLDNPSSLPWDQDPNLKAFYNPFPESNLEAKEAGTKILVELLLWELAGGLAKVPPGRGGIRTFSEGSGGTVKISLEQARAAAQRAGIDMRMFELSYEQGKNFGLISQNGAGALFRAPNGRIVLTLQDAGLTSEGAAAQTIAHELNHVREIFRTGIPSSESAAEAAAEALAKFFK